MGEVKVNKEQLVNRLRVLFAPDYRGTNPYQSFLARELVNLGADLSFYQGWPRPLGLSARVCRRRIDILHLHWPEFFFRRWLRGRSNLKCRATFPLDFLLSRMCSRLVLTAHNLLPHDAHSTVDRFYSTFTYWRAAAIIAHSEAAKEELSKRLGVPERKIYVVPHGDLSVGLPAPVEPQRARAQLGLPPDEPYALAFGMLAPYKGYRPLIELWRTARLPMKLMIAGDPITPEFAAELRRLANEAQGRVCLRLNRMSDPELAYLLQGSSCAVFNYERVLTSGGACLARSLGIPVLLPRRLRTVDLDEPTPRVARFDSLQGDFVQELERITRLPVDHEAARPWRTRTSWDRVGKKTLHVYEHVLH